jgi:hypothetical protein
MLGIVIGIWPIPFPHGVLVRRILTLPVFLISNLISVISPRYSETNQKHPSQDAELRTTR